jgi:YD repeat-containing protein
MAVDENRATTIWVYDTFGRLVLETRPDTTQIAHQYSFCTPTTCPMLVNGTLPAYYTTQKPTG